MRQISFNKNHNNKLDCDYFTTIRLHNAMLVTSTPVEILLSGKVIGRALIIAKKSFALKQINHFIAYIDAGMSPGNLIHWMQRMYKQEDPYLDMYLLKWTDRPPRETPLPTAVQKNIFYK